MRFEFLELHPPTYCPFRFPAEAERRQRWNAVTTAHRASEASNNQRGSRATFRKEMPRDVQIKALSLIEHYLIEFGAILRPTPRITRCTRPTGRRRDACMVVFALGYG